MANFSIRVLPSPGFRALGVKRERLASRLEADACQCRVEPADSCCEQPFPPTARWMWRRVLGVASAPRRVWSSAAVRPSVAILDIPVGSDHVFYAVRRLSDCGAAVKPCPPWPMNHTTQPGDDAQGSLNGSRTQTAAHCGPVALVSIVAAACAPLWPGRMLGLTGSGENHRADVRPAEGVVREDDRRSILHCQPLPLPSGHCRQPLPSAVQRYICLRCYGN